MIAVIKLNEKQSSFSFSSAPNYLFCRPFPLAGLRRHVDSVVISPNFYTNRNSRSAASPILQVIISVYIEGNQSEKFLEIFAVNWIILRLLFGASCGKWLFGYFRWLGS
ncbi:hypothetical protein K2173_023575 [Erythroxylum novogranatense]|uniref:Uncharacterized protein n=1 Tax=Erythroxylum novogranatense TaxID=1862640 RepID=A0AAV8TP09_9ROSI|nr:hypothetical protein K2173_023575 [Erythroxylum novogranatense]